MKINLGVVGKTDCFEWSLDVNEGDTLHESTEEPCSAVPR